MTGNLTLGRELLEKRHKFYQTSTCGSESRLMFKNNEWKNKIAVINLHLIVSDDKKNRNTEKKNDKRKYRAEIIEIRS